MSHLLEGILRDLEANATEDQLRRLAALIGPYVPTPEPTEPDPWIGLKDAAQHLGLSPAALHKLVASRAHGLEFSQDGPGSKVWFTRTDLDAYRRQHTQGHRHA